MKTKMLSVSDLTRKKTAVLQNAFQIQETKKINDIYSVSFTLPADDPKNQYCQSHHFVRYGDSKQLYRIIGKTEKDTETGLITYKCEHVIATLVDNVLFGAYTYGGTGTHTADVINWLLSKQTAQNWILDSCDFDYAYEYGWEQETILNALFSVPKIFTNDYMWDYDCSVYPWRLSLHRIDQTRKPEYYIQAGKNLLGSGITEDDTSIATRIYPLGYGEGINQLTIKDVNNGIPYLEADQATIDRYGIIERVLVDRSFEDAAALKAYAQTVMDAVSVPAYDRTFDVVDLYEITSQDIDQAEVGKICKLTKDGTIAFVTQTTRILDSPGDLSIELSSKTSSVVDTIADLADRVRIESVYAQGATQLYQHSKDANATPTKGMILSLYFPTEMRQINKVLLKLQLEKFRAYSQTTESGGGSQTTSESGGGTGTTSTGSASISGNVTSGPSSITTTESGGFGSDVMTSKTQLTFNTLYEELTTESGGGVTNQQTTKTNDYTKSTEQSQDGKTGEVTLSTGNANITVSGSTESGAFDLKGHSTTSPVNATGQTKTTTDSENVSISVYGSTDNSNPGTSYAGEHNHNIWCSTGEVTPPASANYRHSHSINYTGGALSNGSHSHTVNSHNHWFSGSASGSHSHGMNHFHSLNLSGVGNHSHTINLYGVGTHSHGIGKHAHTIGNHSHEFKISGHLHTITIPDHTHTIRKHRHSVTVDGHSHSIDKAKFSHSHGMDHTHSIQFSSVGTHSHTFSIAAHSHKINIPAHSHDIIAGIFEKGSPTAFDIYVGGTKKTTISAKNYEGDITQWLLNSSNQIPRNSWIKIEIRPNDLAYVVSSVFVQGFVQSRGGGNY